GPAGLGDVRAGAQRDLVVVDAGRAAHGDADGVVAGSGVDRRAGDAAQDDSIVASAAVDGHDIEVAVGGGRAQRHIGEAGPVARSHQAVEVYRQARRQRAAAQLDAVVAV